MEDHGITRGLEHDARWLATEGMNAMDGAQAIAQQLRDYLAEHDISRSTFAEALGVSPATLSLFIKNKYTGDVAKLSRRIATHLELEARRDRTHRDRPREVRTSVVEKIDALVCNTESFGDDEGKIALIIGDGGHGKSVCLRTWAKVHPHACYVELDDTMTTTSLFQAIARKLGIDEAGSRAVVVRRIVDALANRHVTFLIDEASGLTVASLNQIRQVLVVKCRCPVILAGNADLKKTVMQPATRRGSESLDQFTSRLMAIVDLDQLASSPRGEDGIHTEDDIRKLFQYGGVKLTSDGVGALRRICRSPRSGRLRTCSHVITALHTAGVVARRREITAELIVAAIQDLGLPCSVWIPLNTVERASEPAETSAAATA